MKLVEWLPIQEGGPYRVTANLLLKKVFMVIVQI